jgi:predicted MFS family arabinose efflux permease
MVAEHIAYDNIFLIGSMFIFASLAFSWKFLRPAFQSPDMIDPNESGVEFKAAAYWSFITDRNVVSLVLFCSIPAAAAMIGFLHFFSPVYLNRTGVPESLIGGVLMLYGVSLVYISPLVSRLIDATNRKDLFIALGCVLGAIGFMSFGFLDGIAAAVTAVFFLGLSGSCLQSSQTAYTLTLKATQRLGPGKGVAYVRATSRIGQMLGPTIFSWCVIASDTENAVMNFGLIYLSIALMFILFSRREDRPEVEQATTTAPATADAKAS